MTTQDTGSAVTSTTSTSMCPSSFTSCALDLMRLPYSAAPCATAIAGSRSARQLHSSSPSSSMHMSL